MADETFFPPTVVESMCPVCEQNGETRLMLTKIPHFREVIISSFACEHCGHKNQEVQFSGEFSDKGIRIELQVQANKDTDRQIVKSDHATITIPELEFEIPPITQKGSINTLEGILMKAAEDLQVQQPVRRIVDAAVAAKIDSIIAELNKCRALERKFTVIIDDPSGNSNIENLCAPKPDPQLTVSHYARSREQNVMLGLGLTTDDVARENMSDEQWEAYQKQQHEELEQQQQQQQTKKLDADEIKKQQEAHRKASGSIISNEDAERFEQKLPVTNEQELIIFHEPCWNCKHMGECRMVQTLVPYFKEVIIMAFACDKCGFRTNEIKTGGAIAPKAKKIILKVTNPEDMSRDFLKSDTASIEIPEIDCLITEGSMGGKFTTVEGILQALKSEFERLNAFDLGDSIEHGQKHQKDKMSAFLQSLDVLSTGKVPFTILIDDPLANSYIQNLYAPDPDPNLTYEEYDRTWQQNEDLGLNDMKVENYGADASSSSAPAVAADSKQQ